MSSANKVILVGHLGADPELRFTSGGKPVCNLSVATNRVYQDRDGKRQEKTNWHRVVAWGKQGEQCKEYLSKGRQVYVEGRLENREYKDKDGNRRFSSEVVSSSIVFLGSSGSGGLRTLSSAHVGDTGLKMASMSAEYHHPEAPETEEKIPF